MPRSLPWLNTSSASKEAAVHSKSTRNDTPSKPQLPSTETGNVVDTKLNPTGAGPTFDRPPRPPARLPRTPSTSPPPAPPEVEFMKTGYDADDIWLMVEDEFLSTAKAFTQHIHHAEYVRLKKLAQSRGEDTLAALVRPVDARTAKSMALKLQEEARELDSRIARGSNEDEDEGEDEGEDDFMQDAQLARLMTREQRHGRLLSGVQKPRLHTRASAGFSQSPHNIARKRDAVSEQNGVAEVEANSSTLRPRKFVDKDTSSDEAEADDLDNIVQGQPLVRTSPALRMAKPRNRKSIRSSEESVRLNKHIPKSRPHNHTDTSEQKTLDLDLNHDEWLMRQKSSAASPRRLDKLRADREKIKKSGTALTDEVPTFIF